jgi:hypothetical protein
MQQIYEAIVACLEAKNKDLFYPFIQDKITLLAARLSRF